MAETELKLVIDEAAAKAIWPRARAAGLAAGTPRPRLLRSIYHDTADHALRRAGIALRLRRDGRRWLQTVKAKGVMHGGLSRVGEWEAPAPGGRINFALIEDEAIRERVETLAAPGLAPVCETAIRRASGVISSGDGVRAELAVDVGEIIAGPAAADFREAEIELIEGPVAGLFDLALTLFPSGGVRFSRRSKAERGYLLADTGRIEARLAPRRAGRVPLTREMTAEEAARAVVRECLAQIAENIEVVREIDDAEGPHQLRVGLRRLRSAFKVFKSPLDGAERGRLGAEARWLGREVGRLRDIDVALTELVAREAEANPAEPGFVALYAALSAAAAETRAELRQTLAGERVQAFVLTLARFVECRGWLQPEDIGQTQRLAEPAPDLSAAALAKAWRHVRKRAKRLDALDMEARHELRKSLKQLRYAVEFLSALYTEKKCKTYLKKLKKLQDVFGDLNDASMAKELFAGPEAIASGDPAAQRAVGWVIGASMARAEIGWREAARLWRDLRASKPFWT